MKKEKRVLQSRKLNPLSLQLFHNIEFPRRETVNTVFVERERFEVQPIHDELTITTQDEINISEDICLVTFLI